MKIIDALGIILVIVYVLIGYYAIMSDTDYSEKLEKKNAIVYSCNDEQMAKVEHQTEFCVKNNLYFSHICYEKAMARNCIVKTPETH